MQKRCARTWSATSPHGFATIPPAAKRQYSRGVVDGRLASGFVVFDLEANADRSDPPAHEIIEIGAVAVEWGNEVGHFSTLVRPTRPLRDVTRDLTGLGDADLAGAPEPAEALARFYRFVGNRPLVAHNGFGYDYRLLDAAAEATGVGVPGVPRLDSLELAHLVFPRARRGATGNVDGTRPPQGRDLDELARYFWGAEPRPAHRALDDARRLQRVLTCLLAELAADGPARRLQRWVLGATGHRWAEFVAEVREPVPLEDVVPEPVRLRRSSAIGSFDSGSVGAMFDDGGVLMSRARTPRRQQIEMAELVATGLGSGGRRLIEAPTGTGKTLAYLAPAVEYARSTGDTVVVAPHSKVLQDQIMSTLEELRSELDPFVAVLVKGAGNYLSLEALAGELDALAASAAGGGEPASGGDAAAGLMLAILCGWVATTPTGDWDDLRTGAIVSRGAATAGDRAGANRAALARLRLRLSAEGVGGPPRGPLEERDFLRRARDGLRHAHVGVLNHALIVTWEEWLDRANRLVLDEAHNLEDAATDALTAEAGLVDVETLVGELWDSGNRRSTVHRLAGATGWGLAGERLAALRAAASDTRRAGESFGEALVGYVRTRTAAGVADAYPAAYQIRPWIDTRHPDYAEVRRRGTELRNALRGVADVLNEVNLPGELVAPYRRDRLEEEIARLGRHARNLADTIDMVVWAEDPERWVSVADISHDSGRWTWVLRRVPLSVTAELGAIWDCLHSAILTSATLRVGGSFDHIIHTLGLGAVESPIALDTPFAWIRDNHLLLLIDYLPAPRAHLMEEFRASAAREIPRLLTLTAGRGLALLTARARLEFVRDHARPILERSGIPLLAQGDDAAPALVERIRNERATSLLALRSFWEGVDVPGEALSLLIIEKVPFDSPADPVTAARMQAMELRGKDPFAAYLVPRAALRFAQGVGRLIRTESDRGVTAVLDSRLCRPTPYRDVMLGMLPGPPRTERARRESEAYEHIAGHLPGVRYDGDMRRRLEAVPGAGAWSDLATLELGEDDTADTGTVTGRLDQVRGRFGFERWRPGQLEVMRRFIAGTDTLAVLPTGSGKSITFQIPALISPGLTLVISPLTALMNDQVENLRARGVTQVAAIHSGIPQSEWRDVLRGAQRGDYKLLYVSPERLWSQEFVATLARIGVTRVAVDEAHCISQWGHSFRPEYTTIPAALGRIGEPRPPVLAVTATAIPEVREEINEMLGLDPAGAEPLSLSPNRPEIRYFVEECENRHDRDLRVVQIAESFRGRAAIVYVPTRRDTTRLAGLLSAADHNVQPYHGAMEQNARRHIEDAFRHGEVDVVVATKAFGMGIDKPDIELVVHLEMPPTIEEYVQETGRAVRGAVGGKEPSVGTAVLLRMPQDCSMHSLVIRGAAPTSELVRRIWNQLEVGTHPYDPEQLADGDDETDRERIDIALAVHYLQAAGGGVTRHLDTPWRGRLTILADSGTRIDELAGIEPELAARCRRILELASAGDNDEYQAELWSRRLGRSPAGIAADLLELNGRDILGFVAWRHAWTLERLAGHEPDCDAIEELAEQRRTVVAAKSERAKQFAAMTALEHPGKPGGTPRSARRVGGADNSPGCRRRALLEYFGAGDHLRWEDPERCGACDGCTPLPRAWVASTLDRESLLAALPKRTIALRLISDTSGRKHPYSRRRIVRALAGVSYAPHALPQELAAHPTFGRLAILSETEVDTLIDELIEERLAATGESQIDSATGYEHVAITGTGRAFLGES